jgi:hypothetical protein
MSAPPTREFYCRPGTSKRLIAASDWPAGVASFEISIRNPGLADRLDAALVSELEKALGCQVRQIWAHY